VSKKKKAKFVRLSAMTCAAGKTFPFIAVSKIIFAKHIKQYIRVSQPMVATKGGYIFLQKK
jgi:hypothetical protein